MKFLISWKEYMPSGNPALSAGRYDVACLGEAVVSAPTKHEAIQDWRKVFPQSFVTNCQEYILTAAGESVR